MGGIASVARGEGRVVGMVGMVGMVGRTKTQTAVQCSRGICYRNGAVCAALYRSFSSMSELAQGTSLSMIYKIYCCRSD